MTGEEQFNYRCQQYIKSKVNDVGPMTAREWAKFDKTPEGIEHNRKRREALDEFHLLAIEALDHLEYQKSRCVFENP